MVVGGSPGTPVVAVTQVANTRSRHLLESIGIVLLHETEEHGARRYVYTLAAPPGKQAR